MQKKSSRTHDFTPLYYHLQFLPLANGHLQIAHHFDDVRPGDTVLWGPSIENAATFRVVATRRLPDLQDQYFCEMEQVKPQSSQNKPRTFTKI